jgi:hypothetical protein
LKFQRLLKDQPDEAKPFFWPFKLLSRDQSFSKARILTWGYESSPYSGLFKANNNQSVSQHGNNLLVDLGVLRRNHVILLPTIIINGELM